MLVVPGSEVVQAANATAAILIAGVGPVTSAVETVATSVGAGILLGGFGAGALGLVLGWGRRDSDEVALAVGYLAGLAMAVAAAAEVMIR